MGVIFNKEVLTAVLASLVTMAIVNRVHFLKTAIEPN